MATRSALNIDVAEIDSCSEPDWLASNFGPEDSEGEPAEIPNGNSAAQGDCKRRRLREKTLPAAAPGFPQRALLRASDYKVKRAKLKKEQLAQRSGLKQVRSQVIQLLARQAPYTEEQDDDPAALPLETPHPSHYIAAMPGNSSVIWCKACACWSLRQKLRGLAIGCKGLKVGNRSTLRLLQCGVIPKQNARLPPSEVKIRRRKSRW